MSGCSAASFWSRSGISSPASTITSSSASVFASERVSRFRAQFANGVSIGFRAVGPSSSISRMNAREWRASSPISWSM